MVLKPYFQSLILVAIYNPKATKTLLNYWISSVLRFTIYRTQVIKQALSGHCSMDPQGLDVLQDTTANRCKDIYPNLPDLALIEWRPSKIFHFSDHRPQQSWGQCRQWRN